MASMQRLSPLEASIERCRKGTCYKGLFVTGAFEAGYKGLLIVKVTISKGYKQVIM